MNTIREVTAGDEPESLDYFNEVTRLINAMAYDTSSRAMHELTQALVFGVTTLSGLFATPEMSSQFIEQFITIARDEAAAIYDNMSEAREKIGAAQFIKGSSMSTH